MKTSIKVRLEDPISFFITYTHCDKLQFTANEGLEEHNEITCAHCGRPILSKGSNGHWYYVGEKII